MDKPLLIVRCTCGGGMNFEIGYGKRIPYTGTKSAKILANIFRHFHQGHGEVTEEIHDPALQEKGQA